MTTESVLRDWRYGPTQAERLCAGVLMIDGYTAVDPQHPLGGRDGLKDVLCRRGVTQFVAAAYFPPTTPTFRQIKKKFKGDLTGVEKNRARGFIFFVNQMLKASQRNELIELASAAGVQFTELYHLEKLRLVLDSPRGCGLRLEYLNIPMTHEEQLAFWNSANIDLAAKLDRIENLQLRTLHRVEASESDIIRRTSSMIFDLRSDLSSTLGWPEPTAVSADAWGSGPATSSLDVPVLLWMHRLLLAGSNLPDALIGQLRTITVSVESADGSSLPYTPAAPEDIPRFIQDWCARWRSGYTALLTEDSDARLVGIVTAYHDFLRIHPFIDGNGRMGRAILDQMLRELMQTQLPPSFVAARRKHQQALQSADAGDLAPLVNLLRSALS